MGLNANKTVLKRRSVDTRTNDWKLKRERENDGEQWMEFSGMWKNIG